MNPYLDCLSPFSFALKAFGYKFCNHMPSTSLCIPFTLHTLNLTNKELNLFTLHLLIRNDQTIVWNYCLILTKLTIANNFDLLLPPIQLPTYYFCTWRINDKPIQINIEIHFQTLPSLEISFDWSLTTIGRGSEYEQLILVWTPIIYSNFFPSFLFRLSFFIIIRI